MKNTSFALAFLLLSSAQAFTQSAFGVQSRSVRNSLLPMASTRPDASALVEEALKITAAYGIDSVEAKVAWDAVEEVDSSDNSAALGKGLDEECAVIEDGKMSPSCAEYETFLNELYSLREQFTKQENKKFSLIDTMKLIKIEPPKSATVVSSPELTEALEAAKAATAKHGVTSPEARLAWETYEDIAARGLDNAMGVSLMEECSLESGVDACKAIEELERIMPVLQAMNTSK